MTVVIDNNTDLDHLPWQRAWKVLSESKWVVTIEACRMGERFQWGGLDFLAGDYLIRVPKEGATTDLSALSARDFDKCYELEDE